MVTLDESVEKLLRSIRKQSPRSPGIAEEKPLTSDVRWVISTTNIPAFLSTLIHAVTPFFNVLTLWINYRHQYVRKLQSHASRLEAVQSTRHKQSNWHASHLGLNTFAAIPPGSSRNPGIRTAQQSGSAGERPAYGRNSRRCRLSRMKVVVHTSANCRLGAGARQCSQAKAGMESPNLYSRTAKVQTMLSVISTGSA